MVARIYLCCNIVPPNIDLRRERRARSTVKLGLAGRRSESAVSPRGTRHPCSRLCGVRHDAAAAIRRYRPPKPSCTTHGVLNAREDFSVARCQSPAALRPDRPRPTWPPGADSGLGRK